MGVLAGLEGERTCLGLREGNLGVWAGEGGWLEVRKLEPF